MAADRSPVAEPIPAIPASLSFPERRPAPGHGYLLEVLRLNLMSGMAYRVSFLSQVVFMMLNNAIFLAFWAVFFERFPDVQGWRLGDVLLLFAVVSTGFGLSVVLFGNALRLSTMIQNGQVDAYLSLPPDPGLHLLMSRMRLSGLGDILFGVGAFILFLPWDGPHLALFLTMTVVSGIIFTAFCVIANSAAFFLGGAEGLSGILSEALLVFSLYPEPLFSGGVKFLLFTLIPSGFIGFLPVRLLQAFDPVWLVALLLITVFWVWLARRVFEAGLRRYESGNLIAPRM